jgi:polysaccharide export outer membrane protein
MSFLHGPRRHRAALGPRRMRAVRGRFAALAIALCAHAGAPAAAQPTAGDAAPPSAAGERPASVAVGDRVRLKIWREPNMSDELTVDERGEIAAPRLGVLHVAGLPIAALQDSLVARYATYLQNPTISVTVLRRVGVQGEVRAPNLYYVDATKTLRDVLAEAGGVTESGDARRVAIVRDGRVVPVGRGPIANTVMAELRSGDQVVVPRRSWWSRNAIAALSTAGFAISALLSLVNSVR